MDYMTVKECYMSASKPVYTDGPSILFSRATESGKHDAAQEPYGLGVRVFFYLQSIALVFYSSYRSSNSSIAKG